VTWTKLGDDFPERCARAGLSDSAVRTHVDGLCWTMRRETGGLLDELDLRRALESRSAPAAIRELVAVGWWEDRAEGAIQIIADMDDQPEPDVIQARRKLAAERQRKKRRKDAKLEDEESTETKTSRSSSRRDNTRDPGRVGTGRGKTPTTSKSESRSNLSTDVGKEASQLNEKNTGDWPALAPVGAGLPADVEADRKEPMRVCTICDYPIDPAVGRYHPACYDPELENA
jgi:hypothetical protein